MSSRGSNLCVAKSASVYMLNFKEKIVIIKNYWELSDETFIFSESEKYGDHFYYMEDNFWSRFGKVGFLHI